MANSNGADRSLPPLDDAQVRKILVVEQVDPPQHALLATEAQVHQADADAPQAGSVARSSLGSAFSAGASSGSCTGPRTTGPAASGETSPSAKEPSMSSRSSAESRASRRSVSFHYRCWSRSRIATSSATGNRKRW